MYDLRRKLRTLRARHPVPAMANARATAGPCMGSAAQRKARELRDILAQIDPQNQAEALMMAGIAMMMP